MGRPARSTAPSNFLAMMGSDSENELAEEQDSSDFDGDDGGEEDEVSLASMVSESDDEDAGGKKRAKAKAPAQKKPPAKKPKAGPPKATPLAVSKAPAATPMQVVSKEANENTSPSDTPVSKAGSAAATSSAAVKKPSPIASSPAASETSSAPSTTEKKKAAPKKPAAPKKAAAGPGAAKPAKEAPVKNASDASTMILDYLTTTNRPYGSQNVFDNLHRKIPLGVVKAQLDVLADAGKLNRKEYGKNKVYYALQEECDTSSMNSDLATWEAKAKVAKEERAKLAKQKAELEATVRGLNQSMTDEQLAKALEELTVENEQREAKLESLRKLADATNGGQQADVRNSLAALKAEFMKYRSMWIQRKKNVMEGLSIIADGMDKPLKTLIADIGIETDEEYGTQPPPLP